MICKNPGGPLLISLRGGNGLPPPLETAYVCKPGNNTDI